MIDTVGSKTGSYNQNWLTKLHIDKIPKQYALNSVLNDQYIHASFKLDERSFLNFFLLSIYINFLHMKGSSN